MVSCPALLPTAGTWDMPPLPQVDCPGGWTGWHCQPRAVPTVCQCEMVMLHVCVRIWPCYHTLAWYSQWSVSTTGCCVAFSRKGRKAHSLWQREQGGRGGSPAAAGAKWGCFLPWLLSALCWKVLFSFQGYETQAVSVLEGVQAGACCLCDLPPACLFSWGGSQLHPTLQGDRCPRPKSRTRPQRTLLVRCCTACAHPLLASRPLDGKEPQQKPSEKEFSSTCLIKHLFSEGDEIRDAWGQGGGFDINK